MDAGETAGAAIYGKWIALREKPPIISDARGKKQQIIVWHIYQGAMVDKFCRARFHTHYTHYTKVPDNMALWNNAQEKLPQESDADIYGCVLAIHKYDGLKVTGYHQIKPQSGYTHWMKLPDAPEDAKEVFSAFEGTEQFNHIERIAHYGIHQHHIRRARKRTDASGRDTERGERRAAADDAGYYGEIGSDEYIAELAKYDGEQLTDA